MGIQLRGNVGSGYQCIQARLLPHSNQADDSTIVDLLNEMDLPSLNNEQCNNLLVVPSAVEIKHHMFGMKSYASPNPNGITTKYYKTHWDLVGQSIVGRYSEFL